MGAGGTSGGVSLVPGVMAAQSHWAIPQAQEVPGASTEIDVFNPGTSTESVTVHFRLPSGPLAPLTQKILPGTTWPILTSTQTRIPANETYATAIDATGGIRGRGQPDREPSQHRHPAPRRRGWWRAWAV